LASERVEMGKKRKGRSNRRPVDRRRGDLGGKVEGEDYKRGRCRRDFQVKGVGYGGWELGLNLELKRRVRESGRGGTLRPVLTERKLSGMERTVKYVAGLKTSKREKTCIGRLTGGGIELITGAGKRLR